MDDNRLTTTVDYADALRRNAQVQVVNIHSGDTEGYGFILRFNSNTVTILEASIGVVHYLRENVEVFLVPGPIN